METKKKALGKGLEQLFSNNVIDFDNFEDTVIEENKKDVTEINLDEIRSNPYQPRKTFDTASLNELAKSIEEYGVVQPIIVKKSIKGYELVAGERRTKAAKIAGLKSIPAIIKDFDDQEMMEIALIENIQREDLNPIDKARGFRQLLDEYGLTQQELADIVGISRSALTNTVRLLNLDPRIMKLAEEGKLLECHCRSLMAIDDVEKQYKAALRIIENGETVRDIERKVKNAKEAKSKKDPKYEAIYRDIEDSFQNFFGTKVKLNAKKRSGTITIQYSTNEELERLLELIKQ